MGKEAVASDRFRDRPKATPQTVCSQMAVPAFSGEDGLVGPIVVYVSNRCIP